MTALAYARAMAMPTITLYLALRERDWCSHSAETRAGDVVHYDAETA